MTNWYRNIINLLENAQSSDNIEDGSTPLFHGTKSKFDGVPDIPSNNANVGYYGRGVYFSKNPEEAEDYGSIVIECRVVGKLATKEQYENAKQQAEQEGINNAAFIGRRATDILIEHGYVGLEYHDIVVVYVKSAMRRIDHDILEDVQSTSNGGWPKTISSSDLAKLATQWHEDTADHKELTRLIKKYSSYRLERVPLDKLGLDNYEVDDSKVDDYAEMTTEAPPIIVAQWGLILDGNHRANAAAKRGDTDILAYVYNP